MQIGERAAAEIFDHRNAGAHAERGELRPRDARDKAVDAIVRRVRAQQQRRARRQRARVVVEVDFVRRADFDQHGAAAREHVGQTKAAADLDELVARDDHFARRTVRGAREGVEHEQHGGGAVVDDQRVLGAARRAQQRAEAIVARAAFTGREIVLEVRCAARCVVDRGERIARERGATEVRVQQDPGAVEHADQARPGILGQPRQHVVDDDIRRRRRRGGARGRERRGDLRLDRRRAEKYDEPRYARFVENAMDCREAA